MTAPISGSDPYEVLGVPTGTPFQQVKVVYRRLVRELHPDVNPDARVHFDAVQAAFEILRSLQATARADAASVQEWADAEPGPHGGEDDAASAHPGASQPDHAAARYPDVDGRDSSLPDDARAFSALWTASAHDADPDQPPSRPHQSDSLERARHQARSGDPADGPRRGVASMKQSSTAQRVARGRGADVAPAPAAPGTGVDEQPTLNVVVIPGRDRLLLQQRAQMLYVLLELKLSEQAASSQQPLNVSLVLDHSSSMQRDDKLLRLKEAVMRIIDLMHPLDYLSIITFGDRAQVLLPSSPLGNKRAAKEALDGIRCRGGTEISTGIRAGLQELQSRSSNLISQMILLTDGQTYGDEDLCLELASQAGDRQIQITAFGLGDDWNSALLDELAARTTGHADYVQSADQLAAAFEDDLRALQLTALRNFNLAITTSISSRVLRATWVAPGIRPLPIPSEVPPSGQPLTLDLGRVSTDRDYRLLLELVVASRTAGRAEVADLRFTYDVPNLGRERESVGYRLATTFVEHWDSDPPVDLQVHDALRKITAHRLQEQALQAIQEGQTQKGTASLRTAAKHLEAAGCVDLADLAKAEADRVERQGQAQAGNMKRIIYGTRRLG